jgi:hypothetical protein
LKPDPVIFLKKPMIVYLDTCIISGLARNDIEQTQGKAMIELLKLSEIGTVRFVTSAVALSELEQIPPEHRTPHVAVYHLLWKIHAFPEPSLTRLAPWGGPMGNPARRIWSRIKRILPDENDVKHVYQAAKHGTDYFVTVDKATILKYKADLIVEAGVHVIQPSDLLRLIRTDQVDEQ